MKKVFAILLALSMMLALAAVAETPAVSEISLWTYPIGNWGDEETVKVFTDAFEAETGIKVKVEFLAYGGDGDNKINGAISANQAPDMVMEGPERLAVQWGAQGHMVDLSDMLDDEDISEINPSTVAAFPIADGTLNYFSAEHEQMDITVDGNHATLIGRSRVTAAVFGGGRGTWRLQLSFKLVKREGQWLFTEARASTY